jgi:methylated-DNA-[protein]-cysteine S-methyltransferase
MRCRDVDALWDEIRGDCTASLRETVHTHVGACPPCRDLYEQYEGVAFCLSCLPAPEPSCDLAAKVVQHIATLKFKARSSIVLTAVKAPIGQLYVGFKENRIAFIGIDTGDSLEHVRERVEQRLRRPVILGDAPAWLQSTLERFFLTFVVDEGVVDISDLTAFEQAALRAAAQIPPGEVRSYGWVATQMGRPKAARAVGRAMARNPLALFYPCHRVVDSTGALHNYYYGLEMKARLLKMEQGER